MKSLSKIFILVMLLGITNCQQSSHPSKWSDQKLNEWFESGQYLKGLQLLPDPSIDHRSFAVHYYEHTGLWDRAFAFLRNTDLANVDLGRIELGDNMYATVSEYIPKDREGQLPFEAHKKYIDIQYIVSGKELIDIAPLKNMTVTQSYNSENEAMFGSVTDFSVLKASSERFFIFFPADAHRPNLKDGENDVLVRKIVVKVPLEKN